MTTFPFCLAAAAVCVASLPTELRAAPAADYRFISDTKLGRPGFGDYVTFDAKTKRLYLAQLNKITIFDPASGSVVGSAGPFKEAHGVGVVPAMNRGYASDGEDGVLRVFDLSDFHIIKDVKVADDADGVIFDPKTGMILAVSGDAKNLSIVDPKNDSVRTVALPGRPEYLVSNLAGKVFINIADIGALAEVDIASGRVEAQWPLENCNSPHGLGYDPKTDRLFSSCANGRLVVVDPSTGRNLANLKIGRGSDAVVVDSKRGLAFSSNADGTLDIVREGSGDTYEVTRTIPTFFGGRSMAIDPGSGVLYISHGNTVLVGGSSDKTALRFAWDGWNIARFEPDP